MFTPTETWARATGMKHKSVVARATNPSAITLNMISPLRSARAFRFETEDVGLNSNYFSDESTYAHTSISSGSVVCGLKPLFDLHVFFDLFRIFCRRRACY